MFIGRGFDTDGDGDSDIFIGGPIRPLTPIELGFLVVFILLMIAVIAYNVDLGYQQGVQKTFAWVFKIGGAIVGLYLVARASQVASDYFKFPKIMAYAALTALAVIGIGIRSCALSVQQASQKQQNEAAAEKAEQDRLAAEQQENLKRIFGSGK